MPGLTFTPETSSHDLPNCNPGLKNIFQTRLELLWRFKDIFPLNQNFRGAVHVNDGTFKQSNLHPVLNRLRLQDVESVFPKAVLNDFCERVIFL